jgi:hypothetical protein
MKIEDLQVKDGWMPSTDRTPTHPAADLMEARA